MNKGVLRKDAQVPGPGDTFPFLGVLEVILDQRPCLLRRMVDRHLLAGFQQLLHPLHGIHQLKGPRRQEFKGARIQSPPAGSGRNGC